MSYAKLFGCRSGKETVDMCNVWLVVEADEKKGSFPIESEMKYTHSRVGLRDIRAENRENNRMWLSID